MKLDGVERCRNLDTGNLLQSVGPKTVAAQKDKARRMQEADPRATDAGWDTMGQYWDNLSRRADRLALRTPSYPGIKSQNIPWKDNSRPPTRIVRQTCRMLRPPAEGRHDCSEGAT